MRTKMETYQQFWISPCFRHGLLVPWQPAHLEDNLFWELSENGYATNKNAKKAETTEKHHD